MLINTIASSSGNGNLSDSIIMVNNGKPIGNTSLTNPFVIENTEIGKLYVFSFAGDDNCVSFQGLPDGKYAMFAESFNRSSDQTRQWWGYQEMTITNGKTSTDFTPSNYTGRSYCVQTGKAPYVEANQYNYLGGFQAMFIKLND